MVGCRGRLWQVRALLALLLSLPPVVSSLLLRRAYAIARSPTLQNQLGLLHTTGIAAAAAGVMMNRLHSPQRAIPMLAQALADLDAAPSLSGEENNRRIGVLYQLGGLCENLGREKDEERYLTRAVRLASVPRRHHETDIGSSG